LLVIQPKFNAKNLDKMLGTNSWFSFILNRKLFLNFSTKCSCIHLYPATWSNARIIWRLWEGYLDRAGAFEQIAAYVVSGLSSQTAHADWADTWTVGARMCRRDVHE
jgi:hypothetical protein